MAIHPFVTEEQDFGRGPVLWDADPDVCCAAFQLGACVHTEGPSEYDEEYAEHEALVHILLEEVRFPDPDNEPF